MQSSIKKKKRRTRQLEKETRTPPEQAKRWGVSNNKVLFLIRTGQLLAFNLAASPTNRPRYVIRVADIEAFEASRQVIPDGGESTTCRLRRRAAGTIKEFV
jgi:hypothetical protein